MIFDLTMASAMKWATRLAGCVSRQGVNVTAMDRTLRNKSVFSFLRQLTTWHCSQLLLRAARLLLTAGPLVVQQSIDISPGRRALRQQMRSSDVGGRIVGQTDRRTDGRPTVA